MEKTKRILCIFLVALMLFTSLPMNAFAEEITTDPVGKITTEEEVITAEEKETTEAETTEETTEPEVEITQEADVAEEATTAEEPTETVYEKGKSYTVNGMQYRIRDDGTAYVWGSTDDMPEKVEILSYLGDYPVIEISSTAFNATVGYNRLRELIIPETVKLIGDRVTAKNLEKVEIRGDYVKIGRSAFANSPFYENEENWKDDLLIVGSCLIKCRRDGEVILGEEITSVAQDAFGSDSTVDTIKFYNENCVIELKTTGVFPKELKLCAKEGSEIYEYARTHTGPERSYEKLCFCEDTVKKEETPTLCDGTIGNDEGYWCERCHVWQSGGRKNEKVTHRDENNDGVCDLCDTEYDSPVIKSRYIGKAVLSVLYENGTLLICGEGSTFTDMLATNSRVPWHSYRDSIKKIIIADGVKEILRLNMAEYNALESVDMGSTLEAFTGEINYCPKLKSLKLSDSLKEIDGFSGCTSLESVVIPASIKEMGPYVFSSCSSLSDVKIEGSYINFGECPFFNTPVAKNPDNIKDGYLYIDNCLLDVVTPGLSSLVLGPEIHSIAPLGNKYRNAELKEITVYNPDCVFYWAMSLESYVVIIGLVGSTAQAYARKSGRTFIPFCICEDTVTVPESDGLCDGTIGYTEGTWCERCQMWATGHEAKTEFLHIDENEDGVCEYCGKQSENSVVHSGFCGDNISWSLTQDGTLSVIGTGNMYNYDNDSSTEIPSAPWKEYSGSIKRVEISDGIMSIGDYAFYNCQNLEGVLLSTVLISIGNYAFSGCGKLYDITLPDALTSIGAYAFKDCVSIESVVIPEGVNTFNEGVFSGCKALESAEIKSFATAIPEKMFSGCEKLYELRSAKTITSVGNRAFYECKSLSEFPSEKLISMGSRSFADCESLRTFTVNGISSVPYGLLENCTSLKEVNLNGNITAIGDFCFSGCTSLESIELPETLVTVYSSAFENCTGLKSIFIPSKVKTLQSKAFNGCESLRTITILSKSISIAMPMYDGKMHYVIPDHTTVIAEQASAADSYADRYNLNFIPLSSKKITSIYLNKEPDRTVYKIGEDTVLVKKGAIVTIVYEDGTGINLENRYTLEPKNTDLTVPGEYYPAIRYEDYEFEYKVIVAENMSFVGVPENRTFNIYCQKDEWTSFSFTPEESGKYTFAFEDGKELEIQQDRTYVYSFGTIKYVTQTFEAGTAYQFLVKSKTSRSVRITEVDDVYFELLSDGTYEAKHCIGSGNVTIPAEYGGVPVTRVASNFTSPHWSGLRRITISEGIREIGDYAFDYYDYRIEIPSTLVKIGVSAFEGSAIGNVVLPEDLLKVGDEAFQDCDSIKELTILSKNAVFGKRVFRSCSGLDTVNISAEKVVLGANMFSYCTELKRVNGCERISTIPSYGFYECRALTSFEFGEKLKSIGYQAFYKSNSLSDITFNEGLETIGEEAFAYSAVKSLTLPSTLKTIEDRAFYDCNSLTEVLIPEKITYIPYDCFYSCGELEKVSVKGSLRTVGNGAFEYCRKLKEIDCWDTVQYVSSYSFGYCEALEYASFEKVISISSGAFYDCASLKVDFKGNYPYVYDSAFSGCTSVEEALVGPAGGEKAFENCTALKKIIFKETKGIEENILNGCSSLEEVYFYTSFDTDVDIGVLPDTVKIYGYRDSSVHKIAEEKGYTFIPVEGHIHSFTVTRSNPEKCLVSLTDSYKCSCGYSYAVHVSGSQNEHRYGDFTTDKAPTCTEYGLKSKHCYCGQHRKDNTLIEPLGHTEIIDIPAVAPTATEPGYTHQSHCSVCGETVVKRELITHEEYDIQINDDNVTAHKLDAATNENDGIEITITFELKSQVYLSYIDKTVICKVGEVKLSKTSFDYNGKVQNPGVTVKDSTGEPLVLNRDYKLTYSAESKYSGKYSVRVDYIGNYAGSKTLYYYIVIGAVLPSVSSTDKSISLSWKKGHTDLIYCVYSVDSKGNLKKIADTKNGSYTVSSLKSGTEYRFLVRAFVKDGNGKIYWGDKGNSVLCATNPASVSKLTVTPETKSAKLSWSKVSGATGYRVYKYDGSWKMVKDTKSLSCEIGGLKSGTAYKFYVRPYKQFSGKTLWSADNKADAVEAYTKPSATSKISYTSSTDSVKLSWNKVTGATGYRIYLYDNAKDKYVKVADTSKNSYTVKKKNGKKLKPCVEYKFRVKAYIKKNGKTYWSDSYKTVTTATKPAKSSLTVTSSKGKVNLSWKDVMGESGYQVYYSTKKDGKYKKLTSLKADKVKYSKKLTKGKKYYFKVRAYKKAGGKTVYGSFSSVKSVKIK